MKETTLYPAVKQFLEGQGYVVKSEIGDCDVVAERGEEDPVIVELKRTLNLDVVLQAVQRTEVTPSVYVAVPKTCAPLRTRFRQICKLLRMLGLGLLLVHTRSCPAIVEAVIDPGPYAPRRSKPKKSRLLREFAQRVGDPNQGGTTRRGGIMTAYRQKALRIARHLQHNGPTKASVAAAAVGEPKTRDILYRNVYGWFDRVDTGIYALSPRGEQEAPPWMAASPELFENTVTGTGAAVEALKARPAKKQVRKKKTVKKKRAV